MPDIDPNLVKAIAEQVLAALRSAPSAGSSAASVHAPLGTCTGDYSKFPELQRLQSAPTPTAAPVPPATPSMAGITTLKGVITVSQLRAVRGAVMLAKGAMLTPLAQDYLREKQLSVMTADGVSTNDAPKNVNASPPSTYLWLEGQCPSVAKVMEALRGQSTISREPGKPEALRGVVRELAGLIKAKRVSKGILFVPSAARAACYTNRCASLRAVVATNGKAVGDGIKQLSANVLILEYPAFGFKDMMELIAPFVESTPAPSDAVRRELGELAACG